MRPVAATFRCHQLGSDRIAKGGTDKADHSRDLSPNAIGSIHGRTHYPVQYNSHALIAQGDAQGGVGNPTRKGEKFFYIAPAKQAKAGIDTLLVFTVRIDRKGQ